MPERVVVVGAGPAGLGVAAELQARGITCTVLERGDVVGAAWVTRYEGLRLHTARWLSGSPGVRIPPFLGPWVSRHDYHRYLRYYAHRRGVRVECGVAVERIDRVDNGWRLATSAGPIDAGTVVIATGLCHEPRTPAWAGVDGFTGTFLHADAYRTPAPFRGRRVLVVGSGNSGTEIAMELLAVGAQVGIAVRTPPAIVRRSVLGVPSQAIGLAVHNLPEAALNPIIASFRALTVPSLRAWGLPAPKAPFSQFLRTGHIPVLDYGFVEAVRAGRIDVLPAVEGFDGGRVRLAGGAVAQPDAVICATGYAPGLAPLVGHLGVLDQRGLPIAAGARTLTHAPDLHFVGLTWTLSGMLNEIARQARQAAAAIAGRPARVPA